MDIRGGLALTGPSPRGRGKHLPEAKAAARQYAIPAWAGKTAITDGMPRDSACHPRVGGENMAQFAMLFWNSGPSPRGRGKHVADERAVCRERAIPAWAGKTRSWLC